MALWRFPCGAPIRNLMIKRMAKGILVFLGFLAPVEADQWTYSLGLGIPDVASARLARHNETGYCGFDPGILAILPGYLLGSDDPFVLNPGVFFGTDFVRKGRLAATAEIYANNLMYWNKYAEEGWIFISPRVGLTFRGERHFLRVLGGVSFTTISTFGNGSFLRIFPSLHVETGTLFGISHWEWVNELKEAQEMKSRHRLSNTRQAVTEEISIDTASEVDRGRKQTRKHLVSTEPISLLLSGSVNVSYSHAFGKHFALAVAPQLGLSNYATGFGGSMGAEFYFGRTFYGWHIPAVIGYSPARLEIKYIEGYGVSRSTTDLAYAFLTGVGVGHSWCFRSGFTINPILSIAYVNMLTEPTPEFQQIIWREFGETYDSFARSVPPMLIGLGCSVGWAF